MNIDENGPAFPRREAAPGATVSSLLKEEVIISEPVGFSTNGQPERCESALQNPQSRGPQAPGAPQARRGFGSALSQRSSRPCAEDPIVR